MSKFKRNNNLYQKHSKLEWWYIHGTFQTISTDHFSFMCSVFRHNLEPDRNSESAYSLIGALYDHQTNENKTFSQVDQRFLNDFLEISIEENGSESDVKRQILQVYIEEYQKNGPQKEIVLNYETPFISTSPFRFIWGNIQLKEENDETVVFLKYPEHAIDFQFRLTPKRAEIQMPVVFHSSESASGMENNFYPKMNLGGHSGLEPVNGFAWMDHQWGDFSWIKKDGKNLIVLGWNWYGINFDHGTVLMLGIHRDPEKGAEIVKYGIYLETDGTTTLVSDIKLNPKLFWQSPSTLISYPVEMELEVPELDALLLFKPFIRDQEIPFLGPMRTLWQGIGEVHGIIKGHQVKGSARCELNGYGYIFDFKRYVNSLGERIDHLIEGFLPQKITDKTLEKYIGLPVWKYEAKAYDKLLVEPVWDLISRNGKRWRSLFARHILCALGVHPIPYEELLYSIAELSHAGSLIIDDIEDNSLIRRGEDCIHIRYGNDVAINAANTIYFLPNILVFNHPKLDKNQKFEIIELINKGFIEGHLGQGLDIYWSKNMNSKNLSMWSDITIDEKVLQMYALKSASGLKGLSETAAIIAGCNLETKNACCDFALALGVAFQIIDDVHNFSDSVDWRKTTGEDLREGKLTFVILQSLRMSSGVEQKLLINFLSDPQNRNNPDFLSQTIEIVRLSGALEYCRKFALQMIDPKWEKLSELLEPSEYKIMLRMLSKWLLEMTYK